MLPDHPIHISSMPTAATSPLFIPPDSLNAIQMHFPDGTAAFGALGDGGDGGGGAVTLGPAAAHQIDPNSPDMFKNNIHIAQEHVLRIRQLAQGAIEAIERAYHPHSSPVQASGEVIALKHALETFGDFLRESGVGSLPLAPIPIPVSVSVSTDTTTPLPPPPPPPGEVPTEQKMIEDMAKSVQALFEKRQRRQENAAGIASLLVTAAAAPPAPPPPETRGRRQS